MPKYLVRIELAGRLVPIFALQEAEGMLHALHLSEYNFRLTYPVADIRNLNVLCRFHTDQPYEIGSPDL